jgi:xanthine dehydrogenase YagR molybdenum-binding subunit
MSAATIGPARSRVDGRLKVTGAAKYAVEFEVPNCAYAWPVESNIARGRITAIDTTIAEKSPGVVVVLTHLNEIKAMGSVTKSDCR